MKINKNVFNNIVWAIVSLVVAGLFVGGGLIIAQNLYKGSGPSYDFLMGVLLIGLAASMKVAIFPSSSLSSLRALRVFYLTLVFFFLSASSSALFFCMGIKIFSFSSEMVFWGAIIGFSLMFIFLVKYLRANTRIGKMEPPET